MPIRCHLEILVQDLHYALHGFRRAPLFTFTAVFAIALGIGAGTAVFSVVDRILFRSLPYQESDRLVSFGMVAPIAPQEFMLGYDYLDWCATETPFQTLGSWTGVVDCDLTDTAPVRLRCARVEPALLPALGVQPLLGRNFSADEDRPNAPKVAVISYALWQGRFGADPAIVGRSVPLDGQSAIILGVLPPQFEMPTLEPVDLLVPQALDPAEQRTRRTATLLWTIGRLKPGYTPDQAVAALQPVFEKSLQGVPAAFRKDVKLRVRTLRDRQIQDARLASWILLASVLAVLLISCANVANLLLARAATRQRELAVRSALGAARGRLIREALTGSVLLALAGGTAGCALAFLLLRLFVAIAPQGIPRLQQAGLDLRVLLVTLALSVISGIVFGLAPALRTPRAEALTGWRAIGGRTHLFRQALAAAQIAISLILLTGATLLLRSFWNLQNQALGIRTENVLTATVTLGRKDYADPARRAAFFDDLESRLRRAPGVSAFAFTDSLPPSGNLMGSMLYAAIDVQGRPQFKDGTGGPVAWRWITPGYFSALGIPILRGRGFQEEDRAATQSVIILSDTLARRMFPGEDPLGRLIKSGRSGPWRTIVGIAANVKNNGLIERDDPEYYEVRKHSSDSAGRTATAILRGTMDPQALAPWVRAEVAALDPTLPVTIDTLQQRLGRLAARPRFNALLLTLFAAMGLLLAAIGLYGVISFLVAQRTSEIGVRMALGATPGAVARLILGHAARATAAGALLGFGGSLLAVRLLQTMLFRVQARDPWALSAALALLAAVALISAWIPSRRAARLDPVQALRQE
jgi:putative ABC transport system permease protein